MKIKDIIAEEIVTELEVHQDINKTLQAKGYKRLGAGQDQLVFLEPRTKMILKIFGTNKSAAATAGSNGLTFPQQTFKAFADYCAANPDNEFLPYFSGWETFEFNGQRYLQIRSERLFPARYPQKSWFAVYEGITDFINARPHASADAILDHIERNNWMPDEVFRAAMTAIGDFSLFIKTLKELKQIAASNGFVLDLHADNFMLGSDGHIVINDPFFSGWGKRDK